VEEGAKVAVLDKSADRIKQLESDHGDKVLVLLCRHLYPGAPHQ
jgi:alanine dehydrogenase